MAIVSVQMTIVSGQMTWSDHSFINVKYKFIVTSSSSAAWKITDLTWNYAGYSCSLDIITPENFPTLPSPSSYDNYHSQVSVLPTCLKS